MRSKIPISGQEEIIAGNSFFRPGWKRKLPPIAGLTCGGLKSRDGRSFVFSPSRRGTCLRSEALVEFVGTCPTLSELAGLAKA
jgi:hypothetical protein